MDHCLILLAQGATPPVVVDALASRMYETTTASAGPVATRGDRARVVAGFAGSPTTSGGATVQSTAARLARASAMRAPPSYV